MVVAVREIWRMFGSIEAGRRFGLWFLVPTLWLIGCATDNSPTTASSSSSSSGAGGADVASSSSSSSSSSSGAGGGGGQDFGPCKQDCSKIETPPCLMAVCNTGMYVGTINSCVVTYSPKGTPCDDGLFCTVDDTCDKGECKAGTPNDCGMVPPDCSVITCNENSMGCDVEPGPDGQSCTAMDACSVNGTCKFGDCVGVPKDCSFSPFIECNTVACDPATGKCAPTADAAKNGQTCVLTGDLCNTGKTCQAGMCQGGMAKDCSKFTAGCFAGMCDAVNGACQGVPVPVGTACTTGIAECNVGACDANGMCAPSAVPDGTACNDHDTCSTMDVCMAGVCAGTKVMGCHFYFGEDFELCPNGWTFGGDWECGTPMNVGPMGAHGGMGVIATKLGTNYSPSQSWTAAVATSPPINLAQGTMPLLNLWAWMHTEGSTYDGWNLKVSTDGGMNYTVVPTVTPAYTLMIAGEPAWGGDRSSFGYENYQADLTAYAGQQIILRFAFHSDSIVQYQGVYIDDISIAEPVATPLVIKTASPLGDALTGKPYSVQFTKSGGSNMSVWSLKAGGVNDAWLSIDPMTGMLTGTATPAEAGPVTINVHVEEPSLPSNYADKTFTFSVTDISSAPYFTDFEGPCPNGWTLTSDWQCGTPSGMGPGGPFDGIQCIGTQLAGPYSNSDDWLTTTASSPTIDLTMAVAPKLKFRMWLDSEGSTYDGVNLKISTNNGMSYSILNTVVPAYPLTINGEPAWGGHQAALGWQLVQADLSAYVGQTIRLRFAFRSDPTVNYPGVYIDDVLVTSN